MKVRLLIITALLAGVLAGCRTSEANYRAAYLSTIAARDSSDTFDSSVYSTVRRQMGTTTVESPDGPIEVKTQMVKVTADGGATPEKLHRYNVVVGQFKQAFNAKSMRTRVADGGYPGAFVVETAEPYYFVVAGSFDDAPSAAKLMAKVASDGSLTLKAPCPFILDATARRRSPQTSTR